jgi:phage recombination protein Bet
VNNLVVQQTGALAKAFNIPGDTSELVAVLKATAFKGQVSDAQMTALLVVANQYGLNPWTKEIYAFPDRQNGIVPVVGVDGWSRIINSDPNFDGMDFQQDDESCTCTIYRKDRSHPIRVTEWMAECRRANVGPWQSHPKRMLRHKAMIQCARLAFGFVGIFEQDEAERIVNADYQVVPEADSKAEAWVAAMASAATLADLAKVRADCAADYDGIKNVPQAARAAFSARKAAIDTAVEVVEGEEA